MTENTAQGAPTPDVPNRYLPLEQAKEDLRQALTGAICIQHLAKTNVANLYNDNRPNIEDGLVAAQTVLLQAVDLRFATLSDLIDDLAGVR